MFATAWDVLLGDKLALFVSCPRLPYSAKVWYFTINNNLLLGHTWKCFSSFWCHSSSWAYEVHWSVVLCCIPKVISNPRRPLETWSLCSCNCLLLLRTATATLIYWHYGKINGPFLNNSFTGKILRDGKKVESCKPILKAEYKTCKNR